MSPVALRFDQGVARCGEVAGDRCVRYATRLAQEPIEAAGQVRSLLDERPLRQLIDDQQHDQARLAGGPASLAGPRGGGRPGTSAGDTEHGGRGERRPHDCDDAMITGAVTSVSWNRGWRSSASESVSGDERSRFSQSIVRDRSGTLTDRGGVGGPVNEIEGADDARPRITHREGATTGPARIAPHRPCRKPRCETRGLRANETGMLPGSSGIGVRRGWRAGTRRSSRSR
jgi:hypothetical protein